MIAVKAAKRCRNVLSGARCLGRLSEEKALRWPMIVSAILQTLSSSLSVNVKGNAFVAVFTEQEFT